MDQDLYNYISNMTGEKTTSCNYDKVFMYVKNYCHHSKYAAGLAICECPIVYVLDMITHKLVCPLELYETLLPQSDLNPHLVQKFNTVFHLCTVPQIFVHDVNGWHYVGGSDDFEIFTKSNSTMEYIQEAFQSVKL